MIEGEVFFDRAKDIAMRETLKKERIRLEKMEANLPPNKRGKSKKKSKKKPKSVSKPKSTEIGGAK